MGCNTELCQDYVQQKLAMRLPQFISDILSKFVKTTTTITTKIDVVFMGNRSPSLVHFCFVNTYSESQLSGSRKVLIGYRTITFVYAQQEVTKLGLLTIVPRLVYEGGGVRRPRFPQVPSAVAQQMPVWPIGVQPSLSPGRRIIKTPTSAVWFSVGWTTMGDGGDGC